MSFHIVPVGLRYHLACLNPLTRDIAIEEAPLGLKFDVHKRDAVGRGIYKHGARLAGPEGAVVAFEPEPNNLRLLNRNISLN